MISGRILSVFVILLLLPAHISYAQVQQGYADDSPTPDVQVDRSVLEDLKGYQPPPMFSSQPADSVTVSDTPALKATPLPTPVLTTPKAEDILNHPIENNHVLTEQHPQLTAPVAPPIASPAIKSPLLPMLDEKPEPKQESKKTEKKSDKKADKKIEKKSEKKPEKKQEPKKEKTKEEKTENKPAYRPQTPKTMPAVPSVSVEKSELPPVHSSAMPDLPPTTNNMVEHRKPTIGERMMDAALDRHIEKNDEKIKETLQKTPTKDLSKKTNKDTKNIKEKTNLSLTFKSGQTTLDKNLESQLQKNIIPYLQKNTDGRIQLLSFASATDGTESSARRASLSRALAVRDFMLGQKIPPERIDVRALASQANENGLKDRIDIVLLK